MNMMRTMPFIVVFLLAGVAVAEDRVDFEKQIAPIFAQHCIRCHSVGNRKGDFSIETFQDAQDNEYVVAADPTASHLLDLVTASGDDVPEMPKEGEPLSQDQVALIRDWIAQGATWPASVRIQPKPKADRTWWSLQPFRARAREPNQSNAPLTIDGFISEELHKHDLKMNPPADRRTLIRRATYDLIGLPPTPEEVATFVNDGDPNAYEKLIDRLLDSPHYGEQWGRHWLDVVRFGESNGFERNFLIDDLWPFRDHVIRSINADKPFNDFIREHLAGDVLASNDPEIVIGSAFLVAGPYDDVGNQDPAQAAQIRANTLDEIIRSTSEAFLGLTVGCARCHNHKFDPITQADYFALHATFSGIRHGSVPWATAEAQQGREEQLKPLNTKQADLDHSLQELDKGIRARGLARLAEHAKAWTRPAVDRAGTEDRFEPVTARFVRLVCESNDLNPDGRHFGIDELEVLTAQDSPRNVALASNGGQASGKARTIEDFPDAYGPHLAIDGKTGARFLSAGSELTIELSAPTRIQSVTFSSARNQPNTEHRLFTFVAEYRIEVSLDGDNWTTVASSANRRPIDYTEGASEETHAAQPFLQRRLEQLEITEDEKRQRGEFTRELAAVKREIAKIPTLPTAWIGRRVAEDAKGPFHVHLGGNPQRLGDEVVPASLSALEQAVPSYRLAAEAPESERRRALADWIVDDDNPLTTRVLANRVWQYHFGAGIVNTPNDFGYMGAKPTHPALLDWLAMQLIDNDWRLKPLHKTIMMSKAYQQSSDYNEKGASIDGDSRLLWRFRPRRLSAEQLRDTMLSVSGKLDRHADCFVEDESSSADSDTACVPDGGPGFRLYHFMQDNVSTYAPLDKHPPATYRRAVYHQNARASVVDLMTEFDQPDCAFSSPRRAETTTPLQALTMLNHSFTYDMATALAERVTKEAGEKSESQVGRTYQLCYARDPSDQESKECREFISEHGLVAFCRVLLNTSELIYLR